MGRRSVKKFGPVRRPTAAERLAYAVDGWTLVGVQTCRKKAAVNLRIARLPWQATLGVYARGCASCYKVFEQRASFVAVANGRSGDLGKVRCPRCRAARKRARDDLTLGMPKADRVAALKAASRRDLAARERKAPPGSALAEAAERKRALAAERQRRRRARLAAQAVDMVYWCSPLKG